MNADDIDHAIEEALEKLSVNLCDEGSDSDTDNEEDFTASVEKIKSEIEDQLGTPCESHESNGEYDPEYETYKGCEQQLMFEWRSLEEQHRKQEEQRLVEFKGESEHCLNSTGEEGEERRCIHEKFKEELRRTSATNQFEILKPVEDGEINQNLQLEIVKQQELIKRLEEDIAEERRVFEEVHQERARRTEARNAVAATTLQAALRGLPVRTRSKEEPAERRQEEKRGYEERKEREKRREMEERMKMEWEKAGMVEEEEQHHREEAERRRAEYERDKEQEHHRLERERMLGEQQRKEREEAKKREDERKSKEEEKMKRTEERRVEAEMRKVHEEEEKIRKEEKAKRFKGEVKREEEVGSGEKNERRGEEKRRQVQDNEGGKGKEKEKAKTNNDESKRKKEVGLPEGMDERRVGEERTNVQEDGDKKRKDEKKPKERVERQVEEERKDVKRIDYEKETRKSRGIRVMEEKNVQEEMERNKVEEARRAEDERKRKEDERQKQIEERKTVEEEEKRKEGAEKRAEFGKIKRKEEKWERMDEEKERKERLKQKELEEDKTEQMPEEQQKKCRENDKREEEIITNRNKDGENTEEINGNISKDSVIGCADQREKDNKSVRNVSQLCLSEYEQRSQPLTPSTDSCSATVSPSEEKNASGSRRRQNSLDYSSFAFLPDSTEQKRLAWMMNCTPWTELFMQYKRKRLGAPPRRRGQKRSSGHLLPLPVDAILCSGAWSSLIQVTSVTLEDLSGCSLSTLSECPRLRSLSLRRCKLRALDGLNQCTELQYIDLQENNITYVDCRGLARLGVLLLGRNQLTSIHGLDDAVNLHVLQLSYNIISRIGSLASLKKLHRLIVDHNQLISTRGLSESFTLLDLDCSYNHLSHVEGLENCALLNTLDLRGNNLTELPVFKNHVLLRELYLDDNNICSLHDLDSCWLPLLRCLSVPQNSITQLPLLVDLLSLKTLDVSFNCLSELRNICMSLQGCTHLQELSIMDNPVQQENNWRSSVLAVNSNLIKLNGEQTGASGTLSADSTQLWSFQALCQAHQDQIDSVLQRHSMEIRSAPSALHAQLLVGNHTAELFHLAEEQRYAHEYGVSGVCDTAMQESVASRYRKELSFSDLAYKESTEDKSQQPSEHKTPSWQAPHLLNFTHRYQSPSGDRSAGCAGSCKSPTQKFRDTQPSENRYSRSSIQASSRDQKIVAVMVIQRYWREYRQKRHTGLLGPHAGLRLEVKRKVKASKTSPECLYKDSAATVIQAAWRGYTLRKRLTRALMLAQISEEDEAFVEVDMDEFIFDEEAMERDWSTLHSDVSPSSVLPYSEQLQLPKNLLPLSRLHMNASVHQWKARQAWLSSEDASRSVQSLSPDPNIRTKSPTSTLGKSSLSERSEKLLEEWGISNSATALLMLKRAQRMKARKQQHQRNLLADRGDVSIQEALRGEPEQTQTELQTRHRTYQRLQTQAVPSRRSCAPAVSDHFLPEIDPEILSGRRIQLMASTSYRGAPESAVRQSIFGTGFSSLQDQQVCSRTHRAGHARKEVPFPQRVTSAPSRKERISFRDNPMQLSGGWGGGKKRSKVNKLK